MFLRDNLTNPLPFGCVQDADDARSKEIYQIPDQVVANYRYFVENDEEPVTAAPVPLKKGIKVRVVAGSMKGVEAYVQSYNGKKAVIGSEIKYISGATLTISRNLLEVVEED